MTNYKKEIAEFTKQLVTTPSQNGVDSEAKVAELVINKLRQFGFSSHIVGPSDHPSIICLIPKPGSTKTIWMQSCLDTAPVGDISKWHHPPIKPTITNNKLFGNGAADSKIAIAIFCYLAKALYEDKDFSGTLLLGFDADEQSGQFTGMREILKKNPPADTCILGYQGIDEISIGARGFLRLKLTTFGKAAHTGSRTKKGVNAIHSMNKAITKLLELNIEASEPFFEYGSAFNISQISGGHTINIVPENCEALVDIRLTPSQKSSDIMAKITDIFESLRNEGPAFSYQIDQLGYEEGFLTNPNEEFVSLLQKQASQTLGKEIPLTTSGPCSVGTLISKFGIPIINSFGCASGNVHAPNEWVDLDTISPVFDIYYQTIKRYCSK